MLSFRSKCLLKRGRKWRKNSNKAYLMGTCPQADRCLWMMLSDELWWNSRLSSKLMCRLPSSLPWKWIIPWSPKNKLTQSTEFWIPPLRCSFQRCLRCNPKILPSFIVNWRFSSTQTRTIIRRQRMRSRLSKERTRLPEPRCALPKAPSEWSAGHPRATAVTSKCPHLMSPRGFRRTIIISEEWDLLSESKHLRNVSSINLRLCLATWRILSGHRAKQAPSIRWREGNYLSRWATTTIKIRR